VDAKGAVPSILCKMEERSQGSSMSPFAAMHEVGLVISPLSLWLSGESDNHGTAARGPTARLSESEQE
jgi:hypothetical protein